MSTKSPREWTSDDVNRMINAISVLQSYGLDTSSTTMHLSAMMPDALQLEPTIGPDDPAARTLS